LCKKLLVGPQKFFFPILSFLHWLERIFQAVVFILQMCFSMELGKLTYFISKCTVSETYAAKALTIISRRRFYRMSSHKEFIVR